MKIRVRRSTWAAASGFGIFIALGMLSMAGMMRGIDTNVAGAEDPSTKAILDACFPYVAIVWGPEPSVFYGLVGTLFLWRLHLGSSSLAPLSFLLLVPMEVAAKLALHPPLKPALLKDWPGLLPVSPPSPLGETFFSGSAVRTAFFCALLAIVLWRRGGVAGRSIAAASIALGTVSTFVKVYGRYHWASNEFVGITLGVALAILVGFPLAERLVAQRMQRITPRTRRAEHPAALTGHPKR